MDVWLVKTGESLPIDRGQRLFRMGMLAQSLVERGHSVVWWTSTFDHINKVQRATEDCVHLIEAAYEIRMLRSPGYSKNTSLARIADHLVLARRFREAVHRLGAKPDLIVCSYPTIGLAVESCDYGSLERVPVVIDIRDLWPDTFISACPACLRGVASAFLSFVKRRVRRSLRQATAIVGVTPDYVSWGVETAGRQRTPLDKDFPLVYTAEDPDPEEQVRAFEYWREQRIEPDGELIACFFGTIGRHFDFETVVKAATILDAAQTPVRFVICGDGDDLAEIRKKAAHCSNIIFPGWVGRNEIWALLRLSSFALAPYMNTNTMARNIPNKIWEYLSAALPVITSLGGEVSRLLLENDAGFWYQNGDAKALADTVATLAHDAGLRLKMSENAKRVFSMLPSPEQVYRGFAEHLERTVAISKS